MSFIDVSCQFVVLVVDEWLGSWCISIFAAVSCCFSYPSGNFRIADDSPAESSSTQVVGARDRTFHRLMAATRKRKAEDRHAREALAQDNLYPRIAALSRRVLRSEKV